MIGSAADKGVDFEIGVLITAQELIGDTAHEGPSPHNILYKKIRVSRN
jgi:hypothetical protein